MSDESFTEDARNQLMARLRDVDARLSPPAGQPRPNGKEYHDLKEQFYSGLSEYFDRLPRIPMSACPFCGHTFKHSFDPFGLDGYWWHVDLLAEIDEPAPCNHFQVLLGALHLHDREPEETREKVQPGPEVPFVVPKVLDLPGMVAVIGETTMTTGDTAYPIAYFSEEDIAPLDLHQPWCRDAYWFKGDTGEEAWAIATDPWEFDLAPFVQKRRVRWVNLGEAKLEVQEAGESREACPFLDLPGERRPQFIQGGEREYLAPPNGQPVDPFGA